MTDPPAALLFRRSPDREERQRRLSKFGAVLPGTALALIAVAVALSIAEAVISGRGFESVGAEVALPCGMAPAALISIQYWRIERRLAGLELSITEEGVTYRSVAGTFPAPWSAVRRMAVYGRPKWHGLGGFGAGSDFLLVQARDWSGPVTMLAHRTATHRMPLDDTGLDALAIARAVRHLSHGRITVTSPAFKRH